MEGHQNKFNFKQIFEYCLLALVFFTPIIFYPGTGMALYSAKISFVATICVVFIAAFLAYTLSTGKISFPKSKLLIPVLVFPLVALISSVFSGQFIKSTLGIVFDLGTSSSLFLLSFLFFVALFSAKDRLIGYKSIFALIASAGIVVLHLLLRALASYLPNSFYSKIPDFLVGGAIDTAIFLGVAVIMILSVLNMGILSNKMKYAFYALLFLSMVFIGAVGFTQVIISIGLFSLIYFVYVFSWQFSQEGGSEFEEQKKERPFVPSLIVLLISAVLILSQGALSGYLSRTLNINSAEVRPNFEVTSGLVLESWKQNPVLGVGPNMFKEIWDSKHPIEINSTDFWGADFNFGSGFVPTVAATTGALGLLALLAFLFVYLKLGFQAVFSSGAESGLKNISTTFFLVSLFLWVMSILYVPGLPLLVLMFISSGIFAATLVNRGVAQDIEINIIKNPKANFVSVFLIVILLLLSISGGYVVWERAVAALVFQKGNPTNALSLAQTDTYWRGFSEISLGEVNNIIGSVASSQNLDEAKKLAIQKGVSDAVFGANQAIAWNEKNYQNWFVLGRIYEILASNGLDGAVQNSKNAYLEAEKRAPQNPAIKLAFARLAAIDGDMDEARRNINLSLEFKNNYTDAYFTLAQIEAATNNVKGAIESVERATLVSPQNAALYFQLGLLKYNEQNYVGAALAFEKALILIPDYANARYFLGLSYQKLGRTNDSITQFEEIRKTNPDNQEVNLIIENLKSGKSPFSNAALTTDDPEDRPELPIEE